MLSFIRLSKLWFTLSGLAVTASIGAVAVLGLNLGIDFTGGSLLEVKFAAPVSVEKISETLTSIEGLDLGNPVITPVGVEEVRYLLRFRYLENETEQATLENTLSTQIGAFTTERLTTVGPTIGQSLRERAVRAISYAAIAIILFIAATFRDSRRDSTTKYALTGGALAFLAIVAETMVQVEQTRWIVFLAIVALFLLFLFLEIRKNNPSLKYGVCAILALLHDVTITLGVFAVLGALLGVEVDALFVTALLTIMGFSVHDTIVVFDRLRENLKFQKASESFGSTADKSLRQTLARSINTSFSTLLTLGALFVLGAESIHWFVAALMVGIVVGTYSSIFIATPLLVVWQRRLTR